MPVSSQVVCCPRSSRPAALRLLHDRLPPDQRSVLTQVLDKLDPADEAAWQGLLVVPGASSARGSASLNGAIWVQRAAGNTAVVWGAPDVCDEGQALLHAAAQFIDGHQIPLAQMVVGENDGYRGPIMASCGFPRFAELAYLFAEIPQFPADDASTADSPAQVRECEGLHFVSQAGDEPQRLAALIEQTYVGTLDCPGLDGIRPMDEVLEGYRAQGRHSGDDWYFVVENGVDVGVLILAEHPGLGNWELVYMGVIPRARGNRCGDRIVRFALELAARRGAERLVLAVDEANTPALRAYQRAGFVAWDRRIVYARLRAPA